MDTSEIAEETSQNPRETRTKRRAHEAPRHRRARRIVAIVIAVILAILLILAAIFAWNRWWRFDDAADIQGEWYILGTASAITIDAGSINLNAETAYAYSLDTGEKTIVYNLGNLAGQGHYRFGENREYLIIQDGSGFTTTSTLIADFQQMLRDWGDTINGTGVQLPQGDGIIVLSRKADRTALALSKDPIGASAEQGEESEQPDQAADSAPTSAPTDDAVAEESPSVESPAEESPAEESASDEQPQEKESAGEVGSSPISDDVFASISDTA